MLTKWIISRIPNHEDVKNERVRSAYGKAASLVGIGCNVLLFAGKLVAGLLSGSVAIMADAVNNLSDASSSLISLLGFKLADRPADAEHPYGHGRFEYLSGMTVAVMILAIGVELLRSSVGKIFAPEPIVFSWVSVGVLAASIVVKCWMAAFNANMGRRIGSTTLEATASDSRNDVITTGAVLLCTMIARLTGLDLDGYVGAAVAAVILVSGEELAKRTFNPRLGVVGGLSVLGTTGVVRPMSEEALKETIRLELSVRKSQGAEEIGLVFGSQGERAANALFPCMQAVQMSNFVGFALDCAAELGFARATLLGQPGKLVKVSGGSMQTHSQYGDGRRETLIAHLALMGAPVELLEFVRQSVTLDGCISPIYDAGFDAVWTHLADAAAAYAAARIHGEMRVDAVMLDAKGQILGRSTSL